MAKFKYFIQNPILYYREIRHIVGYFDNDWYAQQYNEAVSQSPLPPILHYAKIGWRIGYNPSPLFSTEDYLKCYPDVALTDTNPLLHYARYGEKEGRLGHNEISICKMLYEEAERHFTELPLVEHGPWLSLIVPTYNTPPHLLDEVLASFLQQKAKGVTLIFSDDGSSDAATIDWLQTHTSEPDVLVILNQKQGGISAASNSAIAAAQTEWISFLDHDDVIAPNALKVIYKALSQNPSARFLYTDEAIIDEKSGIKGAFLKPAFDPVLLSGINYINHFSIYKRERVIELGSLRTDYDGSQDYDLLLRYFSGLDESDIYHLPYPAYWWREQTGSYSDVFSEKSALAARRALSEYYAKSPSFSEVKASPSGNAHKVVFNTPERSWPMVSVIIPNLNSYELINQILNDLYKKTEYPNFEVIVIDNGSDDSKVIELYKSYEADHSNFKAYIKPEPFNFARMINHGFQQSRGEHFLLLNNDIEVIDDDWLKEMVSCLDYDDVGIVGAKLLYLDNTIQHAGVIIGFDGLAAHWYGGTPHDFGGPMNRLHFRNSTNCVTGAVMLISAACKADLGDFDEEHFAIAYNDVDYCLRAREKSYRCIWTPYATLYHHESASRGSDLSKDKQERFNREKANLKRLHQTDSFEDPMTDPFMLNGAKRVQNYFNKTRNLARHWFQNNFI